MTKDAETPLAAVNWQRVARLEWVQQGWLPRLWELVADGEPVARFHSRAPFGRQHRVTTLHGEWSVKTSVWGAHSVVSGEESEPVVRSGKRGFRRFEILRRGEPSLVWRAEGLFRRSCTVENGEGFPMFHCFERPGLLKLGAEVRLEDAGRGLPDLEALMFLAWGVTLSARRARAS